MSASNWAKCPRCKAVAREQAQARVDEVTAMYGVVSAEEYEAARAELVPPDAAVAAVPPTFREDYEFHGASTGTVTTDYGGECSACGLTARLKHEVLFYPVPEPS